MKNQTPITDKIRYAAEREAEAWHTLCLLNYADADWPVFRKFEQEWEAARDNLADALKLHGDERYRARLIYRVLCTLNGVPEFEEAQSQF